MESFVEGWSTIIEKKIAHWWLATYLSWISTETEQNNSWRLAEKKNKANDFDMISSACLNGFYRTLSFFQLQEIWVTDKLSVGGYFSLNLCWWIMFFSTLSFTRDIISKLTKAKHLQDSHRDSVIKTCFNKKSHVLYGM